MGPNRGRTISGMGSRRLAVPARMTTLCPVGFKPPQKVRVREEIMVRKFYLFFSALIMFVSILNIIMIGRMFAGLSLPALWFIGTNLLGILLGLFNIVRVRVNRKDWFLTTKAIAANAVCLLFYLLIALQLGSYRSWTVVAVAGLLLVSSIFWKPLEREAE